MKILLICKRYYTNRDLIGDRFGRLFYLPTYLSQKGFEVTVLTANYRSSSDEIVKIGGVEFLSYGCSLSKFLLFPLKVFLFARKYSPDVIIASGDSHLGYLGLKIAEKFSVPFIFDVYDFYPAFGSNRIYGMKSMFYKTLRMADKIIVASTPMKNIAKKYNSSVAIIPNGINDRIFKPIDKNNVRKKLSLNNKYKIIGYFGSMEQNRGIDDLLSASKNLVSEFQGIILLLAGKNAGGFNLSANWIDYRGEVSQTNVSDLINACDVCVLPYYSDTLINMGNSCKTLEYISCNVPIVSSKTENILANHTNLDNYPIEFYCPGDVLQLTQKIKKQLTNHYDRKTAPQVPTWSDLGQQLLDALNDFKN